MINCTFCAVASGRRLRWRQNSLIQLIARRGSDAVLVIDDTSMPRKESLVVSLRNMLRHGQDANCQTLVSLKLARGEVP